MGRVGKHDEDDSVESHYRLRTDQSQLKRVDGERLGQTFFFCDMRRAVIIVNLVTIVVSIGMLLLLMVTRQVTAQLQDDFQDDFLQDDQVLSAADQASQIKDVSYVYHVVWRIVCAALGALGGLFFHTVLVAFSTVSLLFDVAVSIVLRDWVGIFMAPIFLYPHLMFLRYLRSGLMSPENYRNEMQSCCCV
jgi:hypothetical protein